jgi:hypothetical protein
VWVVSTTPESRDDTCSAITESAVSSARSHPLEELGLGEHPGLERLGADRHGEWHDVDIVLPCDLRGHVSGAVGDDGEVTACD